MIDFVEMARVTREGQAHFDAILAQQYDNFDQYMEVNKIDDLEVAKVVIKRLLDKVKDLEQDIADMDALAHRGSVDSIIADAAGRAEQTDSERDVCKVNFRRVYGVGLGEINVFLDIVPEEYRQGKVDFSLTPDERIQAYGKAVEALGEDISDFVIFSAEMVGADELRKQEAKSKMEEELCR